MDKTNDWGNSLDDRENAPYKIPQAGKPYSDRRWWDVPITEDSGCNTCKHYYGRVKCAKHPDGIPREKLKQSFPSRKNYETYCEYRRERE